MRARWRGAALVATILVASAAAERKEPPVAPGPAPSAAETAATIPASEASVTGARTVSEVRDITTRLVADSTAATTELDESLARVEGELRDPGVERTLAVPGATLADLDAIQRRYSRIAEGLDRRADATTQQSRAIDAAMARLREMDDVWKRTADVLTRERLPAVVTRDVATTRAAVAEGLAELAGERDRRLALAARVGALQVRVKDRQARIDAAITRLRRELLLAESAPLWGAITRHGTGSIGDGFRQGWSHRVSEFSAFLSLHPAVLVGRVLGFSILLGVMLVLRQRTRLWATGEPTLATIKRLSVHPIAAATFAGAFLSLIAATDDPVALVELSRLLIVVPAYLLLRGVFSGRLSTLPTVFAVVAITDSLRRLLPPLSAESRLLLLLESLGTALWGAWVLRRHELSQLPVSQRSQWIVFRAGQIAIALLGGSLVANAVGAATLAIVLTRGVFGATLLAIALRAAVTVGDGLVVAVLEQSALRTRPAIGNHIPAIRRGCRRSLRLLGIVIWAMGTLAAFGVQDAALAWLGVFFGARLETGSLSVSLRDGLAFALTLWIALVVARVVRVVLEEEVLNAMVLPRGVPAAVSAAVNYLILFIGFLFAVSAAGVDLGRVTLVAGAFSVGIGFGLQNVINNFVSGLILLFERPVRVGDVVEIGGTTGTVSHMGIRSSRVRTFDGSDVIIPNGALIQDRFTNWTLSDFRRRIDLTVGVAYGTDPARVITLLVAAAETIEELIKDPPPQALFVGFGESSLDFVLRAWTAYYENIPVIRSSLALAVHAALRDGGVEIPFPQRDLHVRSDDRLPTPPRRTS